jgi:[amino group carrier protein]-L-2-aminoadipate 6-kinase
MLLLKIGGGREININGIAEDLAVISGPVIVVHGANAWRDELAQKLEVAMEVVTSTRGYDSVLSTDQTMDVMLMAYAGLRNKRIVECFVQHGIAAIGLTGLDACVVQGRRNPGIQCRMGDKLILRRDLSGKPKSLNVRLLQLLTDDKYVPVLTVPICDEGGRAISADNDDIIAALHAAFHATTIVSLFEAPGFLRDPADDSSVVPHMNAAEVKQWEENSNGRIKRKLHAIGRLLDDHPTKVILADGRTLRPIRNALEGHGTVIA